MLFALGFIVQFVIGGITGVMTALVPFDWQAHDTYFVVGHIHYVLAGGSVFALLAGVYYWFPKMTGRMFNERLGRWSFWLTFTGFNLTFFPMHVSGLIGMARRVYTYMPGLGLETPNLLSTIGAFVFAFGFLVVLWNILVSRHSGAIAGRDPWGANTLEWATESPPEPYNFAHPPVVTSRDPLWDGGYSDGPAYDQGRLTPMTSALDAELQKALELPEGNVWTLVLSLGLLGIVTGVLLKWEPLAIISGIVTLISIARWAWPRQRMVLETEA
jgi:cytochrome c oxidase subunit 1/cytochrome c oxidase subunit I+III